jgi:hypothetical protein
MSDAFHVGATMTSPSKGSGVIIAGPYNMGPLGDYWLVRNDRRLAYFPERAALGNPRCRVYWFDGRCYGLLYQKAQLIAVNAVNVAVKAGEVERPATCSACGRRRHRGISRGR